MRWKALIVTAVCWSLLTYGSAQAAGDIEAGKAKASSCVGCHGADGKGKSPNPPIAGMDEKQFSEKMNGYKSGTTKHMMMNMLSKKLSDENIANLAAYYASLPK
ncbi:MAG: cytochrome c [Gammaproteobacteria bacterium]